MNITLAIQKKIKARLLIIFILLGASVNAQNFIIPKGYKIYKDYNKVEERIDDDFDGDGVKDLAITCIDNSESKIVVVYLASKWAVDKSYSWFPWNYYSKYSFTNNVLTIDGGDGEFLNVILKLKYDTSLKKMKLIGYGLHEYVRAVDGTGDMVQIFYNSINLSTNEYQVNGGSKKKFDFPVITLSNIENYFEYLSQIGRDD